MPRIAVTGHMNLTPETTTLVRAALHDRLREAAGDEEPLVGLSCLAEGADALFAAAILDVGGTLCAILPAPDYRREKVAPGYAPEFDRLIAAAELVTVLPFPRSNRTAYEAANTVLLAAADRLIAVWDGQGAVDRGGTAAVVEDAHTRDLPVDVVWPQGARRQIPTG
ncbi:MAG: hypothetical protein ACFCUP_18570 [Actinomycetales bacterium]